MVGVLTGKPHPIRPTPVEPGTYLRLPEPLRLEDTITSAEATPVQHEKDDYLREMEWFLRVAGGA